MKFCKKYFFITSLFFIISCNNVKKEKIKIPKITRMERKELETFLEYLLLREGGIFVLFGSKPIVYSNLCIVSEQTMKKNYENIPLEIKEKAKICKTKLNFRIEGWEKVQKHFKINNYLLIFKKQKQAGTAEIYFVSIANTLRVLQKYYDIFKERVGFDFDPLDVIFEIKNTESKFWTAVKKDFVLEGLIFGYGKTNSFLFEYWVKNNPTKMEKIKKLGFVSANGHLIDANIKVNYQDFPLPVFKSFPNDPTLEKYKKERQKIISLYRGKDPLKVTLEKLCE